MSFYVQLTKSVSFVRFHVASVFWHCCLGDR